MRLLALATVTLSLLVPPVGASAGERRHDVVRLHSGPIAGKTEDGVRVFAGIPYAAPPLGPLRWRPPHEVASWTQVRTCTEFGPACPQPGKGDASGYSEDCLYLNVWSAARHPDIWSAARHPDSKLPVMVWIHGGGFNFGAGSLPEYDGRNLARKDVVVVTLNYRLGPLGFLVHPLLSGESPHGVSGNYGLLDQIAALKWVRRNIAAFGGDPDRVTIFGQSAGSRSVTLLMISPLSAGLFHRAIAQSGGPIIGSEYLSRNFNGDAANVSRMGEALASKLGCDGAPDVLAALRARSAQQVLEASDSKTDIFDDEGLFFAPVFDGRVLPPNPLRAYNGGRQHDVPIIVGSTLDEGAIYLADEPDLTLEKYRSYVKSRFPRDYNEALAVFPARQEGAAAPALDRLVAVAANAQPARLVARAMERKGSGAEAYLYQFTRVPGTALAQRFGAHHGVDLAYVFGNMKEADGYDDTDRQLSSEMMAYWVNFARTGSPNGRGLAAWPAYRRKTDLNLEFADTVRTNRDLFRRECDFVGRVSIFRARIPHG